MKKRLLAMLLVLALSVSMLTVCASALTPTINLERRESDSGEGWFWNGKTQTLILQGGAIDASNGINIDCDATIKVKNDTEIYGFIVVDGDLTVEGDAWLEVYAYDEDAITVSEDMYAEETYINVIGANIGINCGGSFSAEDAEFYADQVRTYVVAEEIDLYDCEIDAYCYSTLLFADENVTAEWSYINGVAQDTVIYAGDDVAIEACELALFSLGTSAVWADGRIRLRDCDMVFDVYTDDLDDAEHPLFASAKDVNALYYDDDDELAAAVFANTSISAYSDVFMFIADQEAGEPGDYNDVSSSDWFADAVEYVSAKGLMIGTGRKTFSPNETVSNAMAWMILARINDAYTMSEGNWYDAAQSFVVTCGLSDGMNPNSAITREAFITMLFKSNGSYCVRDLSVFADASSVSASAVEPMRWAVESGIIKGVDGKLNPKGYMTRAELAEILMRLG